MAKFNIEVELDWIEEDGFSIDEEIRNQVVDGVKNELLRKATQEAVSALDKEIASKVETAGKVIQEKVDSFIENVCEEKIASMKIPYKKSTWSEEVKYESMTEFVGRRYEDFLNRKVFDRDGHTPRYDSDKNTSLNEYFVNKYLEKELAGKVSEMIRTAKEEAEKTVLKTLEANLKDQLAADTIKRLNIPQLLENLQQKAIEFESEKGKK